MAFVVNENKQVQQEAYPWDIRKAEIKKLVGEYMQRFYTSPIYVEAQVGGYDIQLVRYVHAVADVQAQMITSDDKPFGWDGVAICGFNRISDKDFYKFMCRQKQQASNGFIDVAIPTARLNDFKLMAQNQV